MDLFSQFSLRFMCLQNIVNCGNWITKGIIMQQDNDAILFMQIVMQNHQMALMSLGRMENPITKKTEINLDYAKIAIETLDMLTKKTKGNLTEYEDNFLNESLRELKQIFEEEKNRKKD